VSRGRYDAQLYTDDKGHLAEQLSRDVSHRSAMEPIRESVPSAPEIEPSSARSQVHDHVQTEGHSISRQTLNSSYRQVVATRRGPPRRALYSAVWRAKRRIRLDRHRSGSVCEVPCPYHARRGWFRSRCGSRSWNVQVCGATPQKQPSTGTVPRWRP
jgi:hypothetical protein